MPLGIYTLNGMKHTYTQDVMPLFWLQLVFRFHLVSLDFTTIHYIVIVCQVSDLATWQSYFRNVSVPSSKTISNNLMLLLHGSSIQKEVVCNNINILWSAFFPFSKLDVIRTVIAFIKTRKYWHVEQTFSKCSYDRWNLGDYFKFSEITRYTQRVRTAYCNITNTWTSTWRFTI